jgi:hypothetical protein
MGYEASNIGFPRLEVQILSGSPFNTIPKQEFGNYFTIDNIESLISPKNLYAFPPPIWGLRLSEKCENYDNFLIDQDWVKLEEAKPDVSLGINSVSGSSQVLANQASLSSDMRNFFTWTIADNIYRKLGLRFSEMLSSSDPDQARWIYKSKPKPDSDNQSQVLCPFMSQASQSSTQSIHWGVKKTDSIPYGMPFEILYFHENEEFSIATKAEKRPSSKFETVDSKIGRAHV